MFDDDEENSERRPFDPAERAKAKSDEFRMHAELAAVFEGIRKFDASLDAKFDHSVARECQQAIGKLERQRITDTPLLGPEAVDAARTVLELPLAKQITTNDYHVSRRPGEVLILRWLSGEEVDRFYERLQAHFDAALRQFREDEHQAHDWRSDEKMNAYLAKLDEVNVNLSERYLRPILKEHRLFALSTQTADEIDILHLCDRIMNVPAAEVVGEASAPQDDSEAERAWFFKLFSLRGWSQDVERLFFLTYLQRASDSFE